MMKLSRLSLFLRLFGLVLGLFSASTLHAVIIGTSVDASMEIRYTDGGSSIVDATANDSGVTSASVSINGAVTGASAYSNLGFSSLGTESATFDFDLGYNGGGYSGTGYMGTAPGGTNKGIIEYSATSSFDLLIDWNFDYAGVNPFGLQVIRLSGGPSEQLGNFGQVGHFEGDTLFSINAGESYIFEITFFPNVSGGIGSINGTLAGLFNFNFDTNSVPEPSSLILLLLGLGLGFVRRKKYL